MGKVAVCDGADWRDTVAAQRRELRENADTPVLAHKICSRNSMVALHGTSSFGRMSSVGRSMV